VPPDARTFIVRFPPSSSPHSDTIRPQARQEANFECASIFFKHRPVLRSQIRIVLSSAADRRYFPEGWKVRALTQLSWPTKVHKHWPRSASQSFIVLSREALATKVTARESILEDCLAGGNKFSNSGYRHRWDEYSQLDAIIVPSHFCFFCSGFYIYYSISMIVRSCQQ